ncbi:MAG: peptidase M14 [Acidobacteria bacterium]|nr:peptidase M14 [Acidobacteriota bacterium]
MKDGKSWRLAVLFFNRNRYYLFIMKYAWLIFAILLVFLISAKIQAQTAKDFADGWEKQHISNILPSNVRHRDLQKYLEQLKKLGLKVEEVGRSYASREIYQIEFGKGATKNFLWSQMHGDEPTATSALIDMFAYLQNNRDKDWVKQLEKTLTIRAVPMLNPDGAEFYQRYNLQSVDINRDARALQTPEAQLLKRLREDWSPNIGFNLHNQQSLTTVGNSTNQAAISFLVVTGENQNTEGNERNKRLSAVMISALQNFIGGNIGRYVDDYNPRAFGDKFSDWGTPVILVETGALYGKDEMFLVKMNFVAFLSAFKSLVDGSEKTANPSVYETVPFNSSGRIYDVIFRRANVVNISEPSVITTSDVAVNTQRHRAAFIAPTYVRSIGDLSAYRGLEEFDASNFYIAPRYGFVRVGSSGEFMFYKKTRQIDWKAADLEKTFPPDAIFSLGRWVKGEELLPKTK